MSNSRTINRQLRLLGAAFAMAALAGGLVACGGGGGGGGDTSAPASPSSPPPAPGGTSSPSSVLATLSTGTYLEYLASTNATSSSASGTSATEDYGLFRITLGPSATVAGISGFSVSTSGKTLVGGHEFKPAWSFIAQVGTRWLASSDGQNLVTLYDASSPSTSMGFFLNASAGLALSTSAAVLDGAYNSYRGVGLASASSDGGCSRVLTLQICSDTATTFSEREVLLDGVGPAGYRQSLGYDVGGSAPQSVRSTLSLELVGTSLAARDGTPVNPPPWSQAEAMPVARFDARAVALGPYVYLFGGSGADASFSPQRVDRFDTASGTWQRVGDAPRALSGWHATAIGSRIALFSGTEGLLYEPATGRWTATARLTATGTFTGVGSRLRSDGRTEVLAIVDRGVAYAQATLVRYLPDVDSWQTIGVFERGPRANYEAVLQGDRFLLIGGFANGSYIAAVSSVDIGTLALTRSFAQLREAVVQASVALSDGRILVAGGTNFGGNRRVAQFVDARTGSVTEAGDLLGGMQGAAAAATSNGGLYLFGGRGGADAALDAVWSYRR